MRSFLKAILCVSVIVMSFSPFTASAETNGIVSYIDGAVSINGETAKTDDIVGRGDKILTGRDSACEITISDNSIIRIQSDSEILFNVDETSNSAIDILKGWFSGVFQKRDVLIRTPTSVAGIRGTALCIKIENENSTYTCTCNGKIHWRGKGHEEDELVSAPHHKARRYQIADGKTSIEDVGLLYHSDEALEQLARKINVKIDWTRP